MRIQRQPHAETVAAELAIACEEREKAKNGGLIQTDGERAAEFRVESGRKRRRGHG